MLHKITVSLSTVNGTERKVLKMIGHIRDLGKADNTSSSLLLYNYGDQCTNITGGWATSGDGASLKSQYMYTGSAGGNAWSCFTTKKTIDLSKYSKIKITTNSTSPDITVGLLFPNGTSQTVISTCPTEGWGNALGNPFEKDIISLIRESVFVKINMKYHGLSLFKIELLKK